MAPSGGCGGGSEATAFVSPPANRSRMVSNSLLQSSASSAAAVSYNGENNKSDSIFHSRGGHQSHQSTEIQQTQRVSRCDEPNLYDIPSDIHATYRPLPLLVRILISLSSAAISWKEFITLTFTVHHRLISATIKNIMIILVRYLLVSSVAKLCLQELMSPPSRVTTKYLADNDFLPSSLSRYQFVTPVASQDVMGGNTSEEKGIEKKAMSSIGVHSLRYTNPNYVAEVESDQKQQRRQQKQQQLDSKPDSIDSIYLHHGFGASSLSWLPLLPSLTDQLGARVGVAHDSVGFGFTDRPDSLEAYSSEANVGIGLELLNDDDIVRAADDSSGEKEKSDTGNERNIAIFGHSMGAKAALIMALACSNRKDVRLNPSLVVLVAPALEGVALPSRRTRSSKTASSPSFISKLLRSIWVAWRKIFLDKPFRYGLKRLVGGSPNFWRKGLASAWGDSKRLSDSDVLRFQWPSIGMGWEQGLLNLVRSKISITSKLNDGELLQQVVNLPNTKVVIIYGSKDRIVRFEGSVAEKVKKAFPTVHIVRMEGLGHDPFEEDVDGFLREMKAVMEK